MTSTTAQRAATTFLPEGSLRILVADDGKNAADILAMFFEMEGHEVRAAYDGSAAVRIAEDFHPHLVVMDIGMPVMDGLEASRLIRSLPGGGDTVIVALSGHDGDEDKRSCLAAGIDRHLAKPVLPDDLRRVIGEFRRH
jgi:CheY-like chemotaxis protein